jgi:glycosyltransferase involved in cell wall biosynthesis
MKLNYKKLSVLISAHEVSPALGSECSSGWNLLTRLGKYHDIDVLYAETNQFGTNNYKKEIDKNLNNLKETSINFISIPQPRITQMIAALNKLLSPKKTSVGIPPLYFLGVYFWEKAVLKKAKSLMLTKKFDLVHHFNHISYREPGFLYKTGLPFVWGPVSGTFSLPISFLNDRPFWFSLKFIFRNFLSFLRNRFSKRIRTAISKASLILYVTPDDKIFFESSGSNYLRQSLDVGCEDMLEARGNSFIGTKKADNTLRILWVGRLDYIKSLDILLEALGRDKKLLSKTHLTIVGDGELSSQYRDIAVQKKLININWTGSVPHSEVQDLMKSADVLVHTSVKEAGSAVVLESLSAGLPVICHDAFGFSYTITQECGLKIPLLGPKESVLGFNKALWRCINEPELLPHLKMGCKQRSKELSWDYLAESIANDYLSINKNK